MSEIPTYRCAYFTGGLNPVRCDAGATHRLIDPDGRRSPGSIYCLAHAQTIESDEFIDKMGRNWTMEPLDPQAARIEELEAMLKRLEWCSHQSGYGKRLCPICGAPERHGHEPICALGPLLPKEAHDD